MHNIFRTPSATTIPLPLREVSPMSHHSLLEPGSNIYQEQEEQHLLETSVPSYNSEAILTDNETEERLHDDEENEAEEPEVGNVRRRIRSQSFTVIVPQDETSAPQDHIFGIAPYPEIRADNKKHADEIHAKPGDNSIQDFTNYRNRWRLSGNIFYALVFGWWIAGLYCIVAVVMALTIVGLPYSRLCFNFAWYFIWPFGRFVEGLPFDNLSMTYEDFSPLTSFQEAKEKPYWKHSFVGILGRVIWILVFCVCLVPFHLLICTINWFLVGFIPIAKIHFSIVVLMLKKPLRIRARKEGSVRSDPLICTYKAFAKHYYFQSYDGMNICFVNLLPFVLFCLIDGYVLKPVLGEDALIVNPFVIFFSALTSVIPLVYYVGMGVACVSAQSSFGVAAVVNATFGSIVEIVLYIVAIVAGKGLLVVGSVIGSLVGTLLLLPGLAMIAGGFTKKEQRFNSRAAGVSTTLLLVSIISSFIPSVFYKIFGSYVLSCTNCPENAGGVGNPLACTGCSYTHTDLNEDAFYKNAILPLIYFTTAMLPVTYAVGLWFSLRTHVAQIYKLGKSSRRPAMSRRSSLSKTDTEETPPRPRHQHRMQSSDSLADIENEDNDHEHGHGHDAPPWSRRKALIILVISTIVFGLLAELLVQSVDVVIAGSGISEKFLGFTLFAIVPSATEYVNAILFALRNNIALSMEISSQYTVQVTLLQIPSLVIFSFIYNLFLTVPITNANSFLLIFDSFDILSVTVSLVIMSFIYFDGRTDYFKGGVMCVVFAILTTAYIFEPVEHH